MKFFWKIFFTIMFLAIISVTIGGYFIIHSTFQTQLESEADATKEYGEIVFYSLSNELEMIDKEFLISDESNRIMNEIVIQTAEGIHINIMKQKIDFAVVDAKGETLFSSLYIDFDKKLLNQEKISWELKESGDEIYIQVMRPAKIFNRIFYIETIRNVTYLFERQREQHQLMIQIILGMSIVIGVVTFVISKLLLRRIANLIETTQIIAEGKWGERVAVKGADEISVLSENFNQMADCLEQYIQKLKDEAKRKELFVGAFSHELKTPMTSIIGYADLLRKKKIGEEQQDLCISYIFTEGKRLEALSMRLMELIVLQKRTINRKPMDVCPMMEKIQTALEPQLQSEGISLSVDVEPAVISMEEELMQTVFNNLIDNARKSMKGGGVISVTGKKTATGYELSVKDSGIGIKEEDLFRIKEAFFQGDQSRSGGGVGLGLAICNEIIRLHDFHLSFQSTVGVGTVATVCMKEYKE